MSTNTFGLKGPETYEGQWARIARIIGTDYGQNYNPQDLQRMGQHELYAVERDCANNRFTPPSLPVPAEWVEMDRQHAQRQIDAIEPSKRYKAVVWDKSRGITVHLGMFATQDEAEQAKQQALQRRAMGLPLRLAGTTRDKSGRWQPRVPAAQPEPSRPELPADFVWPEPQGVQEFLDRRYPVPGDEL